MRNASCSSGLHGVDLVEPHLDSARKREDVNSLSSCSSCWCCSAVHTDWLLRSKMVRSKMVVAMVRRVWCCLFLLKCSRNHVVCMFSVVAGMEFQLVGFRCGVDHCGRVSGGGSLWKSARKSRSTNSARWPECHAPIKKGKEPDDCTALAIGVWCA